jgi:hypothetical protein
MINKGWKPMPVILKIIWIILIVQTFFSVLTIASVYGNGFDFMGNSFSDKWALNVFFIIKLAFPIVLILGMHQRYNWIWVFAIAYFLILVVDGFANLSIMNVLQNKILEQMPETPEGISEEMYLQMIRMILIISLVAGSLFNLAILILFAVKRKYFALSHDAQPPSETGSLQ